MTVDQEQSKQAHPVNLAAIVNPSLPMHAYLCACLLQNDNAAACAERFHSAQCSLRTSEATVNG